MKPFVLYQNRTKASEADERFNLAVAYANELSSKFDQIMEVTSSSRDSQLGSIQYEHNDKEIQVQAKELKRKDGLHPTKERTKGCLKLNSKNKKARGKKSTSTHEDGSSQIYHTAGLDDAGRFNQVL